MICECFRRMSLLRAQGRLLERQCIMISNAFLVFEFSHRTIGSIDVEYARSQCESGSFVFALISSNCDLLSFLSIFTIILRKRHIDIVYHPPPLLWELTSYAHIVHGFGRQFRISFDFSFAHSNIFSLVHVFFICIGNGEDFFLVLGRLSHLLCLLSHILDVCVNSYIFSFSFSAFMMWISLTWTCFESHVVFLLCFV